MIGNWLRWWLACLLWARQQRLGGAHGRGVDWNPCWCMRCGWQGPRRWLVHGYRAGGDREEVELVDFCPKSNSDHVEEEYYERAG